MKIYLVGGAVRDELLGLPIKEKDWVVVGATAENMLQLGYRQVGKDFPVFLDPKTNEEYALARTERKIGKGYTGFDFNASPAVTLEEDLMRRDLTINAMAKDDSGHLIDPYHGKSDLQNKLLRHVSPAFIEDPVRILRVARFAARYSHFGFTVAPETIELMKKMVELGEVDALVPERVWKELEKALTEKNPEEFFEVLGKCSALRKIFPEDISIAGFHALKNAAHKTPDPVIRFAALLHNVDDVHIKEICMRIRVPVEYRELAVLVSRNLKSYSKADELNASQLLNLLQSVDAFRRESRFEKYLLASEIATGSGNLDWLHECFNAAKAVDVKKLISAGFAHQQLADKINEERVAAIDKKQKPSA
jgi:tRNA nucleotidyltransferase (CCA-adding enzyme)